MSYPQDHYDLSYFFQRPLLRDDGSNFINWYQDLRHVLRVNDILYVIKEPLGDKPGASASQEEDDAYRARQDTFITIQCTMTRSMTSELKSRFKDLETYEMIVELKAVFIEQVRLIKFKCLNGFLSTRMEENTCLESHLRKMYDHHNCLTVIYDYWMADAFAVDVVLRSLPPATEVPSVAMLCEVNLSPSLSS